MHSYGRAGQPKCCEMVEDDVQVKLQDDFRVNLSGSRFQTILFCAVSHLIKDGDHVSGLELLVVSATAKRDREEGQSKCCEMVEDGVQVKLQEGLLATLDFRLTDDLDVGEDDDNSTPDAIVEDLKEDCHPISTSTLRERSALLWYDCTACSLPHSLSLPMLMMWLILLTRHC